MFCKRKWNGTTLDEFEGVHRSLYRQVQHDKAQALA